MPPDDWAVVEEALSDASVWAPLSFDRSHPQALAALARLREREAQLERDKVAVAMEAGLVNEDWQRAEARVAELLDRLSDAEACIAGLEEALREIAEGRHSKRAREIARRALAHKEEGR